MRFILSILISFLNVIFLFGQGENRLDNTFNELTITLGHNGTVSSVTFSPDGKYILTGSRDNTAKLWERSSGREIRTFKGHSDEVNSVAFSPDGQYILTGSGDNTAKLWERSSGKEIRTFKGHSSYVSSVAFSPDGQYILTGSGDNTAKLWEPSSGREIRTFKGYSGRDIYGGAVLSVAFSPDGQYILAGSKDNTAKLWKRSSGREIRTFKGHSVLPSYGDVNSVAFSPDGQYILTGSRDQTAKLWERSSGREIRTFKGHSSDVESVAFSPDGQYILTGSLDNTAKLWEPSSGKEIRTFKGHSSGVSSVAFSPDGQYILTGSSDNTAKLWERSSGKEIRTFKGHSSYVSSVAFSPDGQYILTGSGDNTAKLWERSSGREIRTFKGHSGWGIYGGVNSVAFSPDGQYILTGSSDNTAKLWERSSGREIRTFKGHSGSRSYGRAVLSVAFSPDGQYILTGSRNNSAKLWERSSGREIRTFKGHGGRGYFGAVYSVAFSPDGQYILTGSRDKTVKLWERSSGREIRTFKGHGGRGTYGGTVYSVAFSPDGQYILTGSRDKTVKLWERSSGREIRTFKGHSDEVNSVAFSPDGQYILTGSKDYTAKLWDRSSGREIRTFKGHSSYVTSIAFSPDGINFLTANSDGSVKAWSMLTMDLLCSFASLENGGWIITTPQGNYDGNEEGLRFLYIPDHAKYASKEYQQMKGLMGKVIKKNLARFFVLGEKAFEEGEFAEAEEIFNEAIKQGYELSESYFLRAKTRVKRKLYREAIKDLDLLLALEPSNKEAIKLRKEAIGSLENIQLIGGKPTFEILTNLPNSVNSDSFRCQVLVKSQTPISLTMFLLNERRVKTIADSQVVDGVILTADLALKEGKNEFYVLAVNGRGTQESKTSEIYFRTEADQFKFRKNYALLFSLDSYSHNPPWPSLNNPAYDSKALKELLEKKYGFEVELVENPDAISIQQSLLKFSEIDYQKYDQLWVFYSGHGTNDLIAKNKGKFVPIDSRNEFEGYSHGDFLNQLDAIKCPHIFLVADACYSGLLSQYDPGRKSDDDLKPKRGSRFYREKSDDEFLKSELGKVSRRFLASGAEVVPDGVPDQHSPFMDRLLQTLEKGGGKDNILEFAEIVAGVKKLKVSTPVYGRFGSDEPESNFLLVEKK